MKKQKKALGLNRETLRRLDDAQVRNAAGGGRLRVPGGFVDEDTNPVLVDETVIDDTNP